jgi:hypothetical protein
MGIIFFQLLFEENTAFSSAAETLRDLLMRIYYRIREEYRIA